MLQRLSFSNYYHFENEEDEHRDIDPEISNWLETVCAMKPEEGELNNIYFPRLWREYKKQTGHCFSCGELLYHNGPCYYCKIDFIILEEMTHSVMHGTIGKIQFSFPIQCPR